MLKAACKHVLNVYRPLLMVILLHNLHLQMLIVRKQ